MKLRDFLKKFENLDLDTTEVDNEGNLITKEREEYLSGYQIGDNRKNPFNIGTDEYVLFKSGCEDRHFDEDFELESD